MGRTGTASRRVAAAIWGLALAALFVADVARGSESCPAEQSVPQGFKREICGPLEVDIRRPGRIPMGEYQQKLDAYLSNYCHRNPGNGWVSDKRIRDTGPFVGTRVGERWVGKYYGTHNPVIIWYSPEMYAWLKANRPDEGQPPIIATPNPATPNPAAPIPDGAMMVKEMYPAPAAACDGIDPAYLRPSNGAAIMVRASTVSHDGWFWGWYGWPGSGWAPDWPTAPGLPVKSDNPMANMGFGQYCTNCHASSRDQYTFASLRNVAGHPGEPLVFLTQNFFVNDPQPSQHDLVGLSAPSVGDVTPSRPTWNPDFLTTYSGSRAAADLPRFDTVAKIPSEIFDNVWVMPGSRLANTFVTSDQCLGCHGAGSTGLQFDMTEPIPGGPLRNLSPYGTWRSSPMGLSGRDPFFYAQLASETKVFHPESSSLIQDTCLGCHGVAGQRSFAMEHAKPGGTCEPFPRDLVDATPLPWDGQQAQARFGALARDGVTCLACHRMALGTDAAAHGGEPQNACIGSRQQALNPGLTGLAATFTGSFPVAGPEDVYGPFEKPKERPMKNAIGMIPQHRDAMATSEVCASCHIVHLPVLRDGRKIASAYEQTTYAEWLFSDYRAGMTSAGSLPAGPGPKAQSCLDCHMSNRDDNGRIRTSKIASIQEYATFPMVENGLPGSEIDLQSRKGFALHTLVGLNVFLIKLAQQFPDVLGNRTDDPMLTQKGLAPLKTTEAAILDQAREKTADIAIETVRDGGILKAKVTVVNKAGHKFPSGVGFRRAFVEFLARDPAGRIVWSSGRTDGMGVIRDGAGAPIAGELWWDAECKGRLAPERRAHQPHYQTIRRQDEAQIYQELTAAPGPETEPLCGDEAKPTGPLTTSFLSVCRRVKDNRILPSGYLSLGARREIARAIGADDKLAGESGAVGTANDPDYETGGRSSTVYEVPLDGLDGPVATVEATLYYQATPPFYLQDRFCTSKDPDTERLFLLSGFLRQQGSASEGWKLRLVSTGAVSVPR